MSSHRLRLRLRLVVYINGPVALGQVEAAARIVKAPVIVAPYVGLGRHELGRLGRPCRQTEPPGPPPGMHT